MQQFYNAEHISILSNDHGWTDEDLKTLKEIIEEEFEVERAESSISLRAEYLIPCLMFVLGAWLYPFFQAFFSELGRDTYLKLKDFIVERSKEFQESFGADSFHKIEFVGKYEGIDIHVSIDAKDQHVVEDAIEKAKGVFPLIEDLINNFRQREKEVIRIWMVYSARRRRWELNFANFADGSEEFGKLYHDKGSLEYF